MAIVSAHHLYSCFLQYARLDRVVRFASTSKHPRAYPHGDKEVCGFTPIILSGEKHTEKDLPLLIKKYRFIDFDEPVFDATKK